MLWIMLIALGLLGFMVVSSIRSRKDGYSSFAFVPVVAVFFVAFVVILAVNSTLPKMISPSYSSSYTIQPLYNLETSTGINGTFFLGSGTINNEAVYYYYQSNTDGTYSLLNQSASHSVIREVSGTPEIRKYQVTTTYLLFVGVAPDKYEFDIPAGSILQGYNPNIR
jgi:hypothetical protein